MAEHSTIGTQSLWQQCGCVAVGVNLQQDPLEGRDEVELALVG